MKINKFKKFFLIKNILIVLIILGAILCRYLIFHNNFFYLIYIILFYFSYRYLFDNFITSLWIFNAVNLNTLILRIDPLFTTSQNVYYPKILSKFSYGNIQNFWITKVNDPYPAFSQLNEILIGLFGLNSINYILYVVNVFFIFSIFKVVSLYFGNNLNEKGFLIVFFFTILQIIDNLPGIWIDSQNLLLKLMSHLLGISNLFLDGVSGYSEFNSRRALIPASFDILIVFTIYLFSKKKYVQGIIFGIVISLFHYFSFINLSLIVLALLITSFIVKTKKDKVVYLLLIIFTPIATTITASLFNLLDSSGEIYASLQILYERGSPEWILEPLITIGSFSGPNLENSLFYYQYNFENFKFEEISHNLNYLNPTAGSFGSYSVFPLEFVFLCLLGFIISKKLNFILISNIIFLNFLVTSVSWVFQSFDNLGSAAILHPYRVSGIAVFLSSLSLFVFLISKINIKILKSLSFLSLFIILFTPFLSNFYNMDDPDINFIQDNLYEYTKKDSGAVIIPHEKTSWLLNSGGINAYSSKLFPYDVSYTEEWINRYTLQEKILKAKSCDEVDLLIGKSGVEIKLIISTIENEISNIKNKCKVDIVVYQD